MNQYYCQFVRGECQKEEGVFFKGSSFHVTIGDVIFEVSLQRQDDYEVVYAVFCDDQLVMSLPHPDYVPEWVEDRTLMRTALPYDVEPLILLMALKHVGIAKGEKLDLFFENFPKNKLSFSVNLPFASNI